MDNLWSYPKKAVDKGVFIPRKIMQYKMNILICRKIKEFSDSFA